MPLDDGLFTPVFHRLMMKRHSNYDERKISTRPIAIRKARDYCAVRRVNELQSSKE